MVVLLIMFMTMASCGGGGSGGGDGTGTSKSGSDETGGPEDNPQPEPEELQTLTAEQAWDVLYAAYAGIGYAGGSDVNDDAPLYRVMVADLSNLASYLAVQAIANDTSNTLVILLMSGGSQTFTYQTTGVAATLKLKYNLLSQLQNVRSGTNICRKA